jgi:hypothetical protein
MCMRRLSAGFAAVLAIALLAAPPARAKDDKWVEARSPNFIVVSNAGEQQARKIAIQFEQIRQLFRESLPVANEHPTQVITILAVKDENSLRELLPEFWESKEHSHPAGIFLDSYYQRSIAVELSEHGENPYEAIYHEYYHSLTMPYFPWLPTWVAEGMAEFYGNTEIKGKTASMGMVSANVIELLHEQPLIPLPVLFKVDGTSPYYNERNKVSMFYAESWALTHYLMLGDKTGHRQLFTDYLGAVGQGMNPEDAAHKVFGDLGNLQKILQRYISGSVFFELAAPSPPTVADSQIQVRALSDAEADAYRGGFLTLHQQFKSAQPLLEDAARLDPKLALAQQNLAMFHILQQQPAETLAPLSSAIALDPHNALTRYLRGKMTFERGGTSLIDPQIEADLREAIAANPDFAPPYGLLAADLADRNERLAEALELAKKAIYLEPADTDYQLCLAQVLAQMHQYDQAEAIAVRVRNGAGGDAGRKQRTTEFIDYLHRFKEAESHRYEMRQSAPAGPVGSDNVDTASAPPPDDAQPIVLERRARADGVVTAVFCKGDAMQITVDTEAGPVKLHAADVTKIAYSSNVRIASGDIAPCTDLKGHIVRAIYLPVPAGRTEQYQGEIVNVNIEK